MTEHEVWTQLVAQPGWALLQNKTREYWGDRIADHLAVASSDRDDAIALNRIRQVIAAKQAAEAVLAFPADELRRIETSQRQGVADLADTFSRRGGL